MTEEEFQTQIGAVLTSLQEKDKNLAEEFGRYWGEIVTHKYNFDRQEQEIALIKTLTLQEFKDQFEQLFFQENNANRLDLHFNSQAHLAKQGKVDEPKEEVKADDAKAVEVKADEANNDDT